MAYKENLITGQAYRVVVDQDPITDEFTYDRLSFWTSANDVEFSNHTTLEEVGNTFFYASNILNRGQTTVTISGNNITEDGMIDVYVPDEFCKVAPTSISREGNSVTLTFPVQSENMEVRVVCKQFSNITGQ